MRNTQCTWKYRAVAIEESRLLPLIYALGVLVGAHATGVHAPSDPVWPRAVTRALTVELAALVGLLLAWELTLGTLTSLIGGIAARHPLRSLLPSLQVSGLPPS